MSKSSYSRGEFRHEIDYILSIEELGIEVVVGGVNQTSTNVRIVGHINVVFKANDIAQTPLLNHVSISLLHLMISYEVCKAPAIHCVRRSSPG